MPDPGRRGAHPTEPGDEHEKHGLGSKLLGLFVEKDHPTAPEEPDAGPVKAPTAADEIAAIARAPTPTPTPTAGAASSAAGPGAPATPTGARPAPPQAYKTPDFNGIFKTAGLSDDERDRLGKVEELLRNLPAETPAALKRQIVEGTLRTFGILPEKLSGAAIKASDALDTYLTVTGQDLSSRVEAANKRMAELRAEQEKLQTSLADRQRLQETLIFDVHARQAELREVVSFFGLPPAPPPKVPPVKK